MESKKLKINDIFISYSDQGQGSPVLLLHGYLESLEIWQPFAEKLSEKCRVICPDIPGHGYSGIVGSVHSMELMASYIQGLLVTLGIGSCVLIGHSMGGYVALSFADKYAEYLKGLSLFHSVPFPDTEEKKNNRDREIQLIRERKKEILINTNIPKAFADSNLNRMKPFIEKAKTIGRNNPDEGIIALLEGMKLRPDLSHIISESPVPFLWILGRRDNYISFDQLYGRINPGKNGQLKIFNESGHMGFIEEPELSLAVIQEFIERCK